jgi:DNA polymerase-3 subunit beta
MKFIVSSTALSSHLQAISRVINSKNALPIVFSSNWKTEHCL